MEFCGDGRMEYSNIVRWMGRRVWVWVDGWMVELSAALYMVCRLGG